jgi:hypothetical protein
VAGQTVSLRNPATARTAMDSLRALFRSYTGKEMTYAEAIIAANDFCSEKLEDSSPERDGLRFLQPSERSNV